MKTKYKRVVLMLILIIILAGSALLIIFLLNNNYYQVEANDAIFVAGDDVYASDTDATNNDINAEIVQEDLTSQEKTEHATDGANDERVIANSVPIDKNTPDSYDGLELQQQDQSQSQTLPIFRGITTMQEMTPEVCASEPTPAYNILMTTNEHQEGTAAAIPEIALIDTRDGKSYYVRKFADGNCWMAQNLGYFSSEIPDGYIKNDTAQNSGSTSNLCVSGDSVESCGDAVTTANFDRIGHYYHFAVSWSEPKVCPGNWLIPGKSNGDKNYQGLIDAYSNNLKRVFNYNKGGEVSAGSIINQGKSGAFWTNYSTGLAGRTIWAFNGSGFFSYNEQSHWLSVRCVI